MRYIEDLMRAVGVSKYPGRWAGFYQGVVEEYREKGPFFTETGYLNAFNEKYRVFTRCFSDLLIAGEKLRNSPEHALFSLLFNRAMRDRELFKEELKDFAAEDRELLNYALLFSMITAIPSAAEKLEKKGVPYDIYYATLACFEDTCLDFMARFDRVGYHAGYINWLQLYLDGRILRIGRLNFETRNRLNEPVHVFRNNRGEYKIFITDTRIHKSGMVLNTPGYEDKEESFETGFVETDGFYEGNSVYRNNRVCREKTRLYKNEWSLVLSVGDPVISVHIPANGRLIAGECEASYSKAREIFKRYYPEFRYKAFHCYSWLLSPQLEELLPEGSNILQFQKKYMRYPTICTGEDVLTFVFRNRFKDYSDMSENTSLERALKKYYIGGKKIHETGGVFFDQTM